MYLMRKSLIPPPFEASLSLSLTSSAFAHGKSLSSQETSVLVTFSSGETVMTSLMGRSCDVML